MPLPPLSQTKQQGQVKILRFQEEWLLYPNGQLYFKRKYPIGNAVQYHKTSAKNNKRKQSKETIKTNVEEKSIFEEMSNDK